MFEETLRVNEAGPVENKARIQTLRVLLADNEAAVGLAKALRSLGLEPVLAPQGSSIADLLKPERPDIALLDADDPSLRCDEAALELWEVGSIPSVLIGDGIDAELATKLGIFGVLPKTGPNNTLHAVLTAAHIRACETTVCLLRIQKLEANLGQRRLIEQAKWKLVSQYSMEESDAHQFLQQKARRTRQPLHAIAQAVIDDELAPTAAD